MAARILPLRALPGGRPGSIVRIPLVVPDYNVETVSQTTGQPITAPPPAPTTPTTTAPWWSLPQTPTEYPAPGNVPPSTDPNAYIDPTTGQVVSPVVNTSFLDGITQWIQANPWLSLGVAAGVVWLVISWMQGEAPSYKRHRRR